MTVRPVGVEFDGEHLANSRSSTSARMSGFESRDACKTKQKVVLVLSEPESSRIEGETSLLVDSVTKDVVK